MKISTESDSLTQTWRRNQLAVTVATFIGSTGFTLVMPLLPLYFRQLGVQDLGEVALWSGISVGITPGIAGLMAPVWGKLADRYGKKPMVIRALLTFVAVNVAMAYVTAPWQIFALRFAHGLFAGYGSLTLAMAAASSPKDRLAESIGMVQMARRLGPTMGPVMGGGIAGLFGLRNAFLVAAVVYIIALLVVVILYTETKNQSESSNGKGEQKLSIPAVLRINGFFALVIVIFILQYTERSLAPILPLYIGKFGVLNDQVPVWSGVIFSLIAASGALGNHLCSRFMPNWQLHQFIALSVLGAAVAAALMVIAPSIIWFLFAAPIFGVSAGLAMTAAYTAAGHRLPESSQGVGFGVLSSGSMAGMALSPILSGAMGTVSLEAVFIVNTVALLGLSFFARRNVGTA